MLSLVLNLLAAAAGSGPTGKSLDPKTRGWAMLALVSLVGLLLVLFALLMMWRWRIFTRRVGRRAAKSAAAESPDAWRESAQRMHLDDDESDDHEDYRHVDE